MRPVILTIAVAAALVVLDPSAADGQGPPARAETQRDQARGQQGDRPGAQPQRGRSEEQRPPQAQQRGPRDDAADRAARPDRPAGEGVGRDRPGPPAHARGRGAGSAPDVAAFNRGLAERVLETRARRHAQAPTLQVRRAGGEVRMVRPDGRVIFALREETADRLGYWRAVVAPPATPTVVATGSDRYPPIAGNPRGNGAPSFCRSGDGHPVWGRNWCLDKGFGLGDGRARWGVARTVEDVVFGRPQTRRRNLDRADLAAVLGEVAFGRLALQAVVLGATDPLTGTWMGDADGPLTLRVVSGSTPVAELVDYDRDRSVDAIVFNLGR
jgi:hypothetical protein